MTQRSLLQTLRNDVLGLCASPKCRKCGCLRDTLASLAEEIVDVPGQAAEILRAELERVLAELPESGYSCLGCDPCDPPEMQNEFHAAAEGVLPLRVAEVPVGVCAPHMESGWPPIAGEYHVLNPTAPVAVSTLASTELPAVLAALRPEGLAIVGPTETENLGLDKVVKNIFANPAISALIVAGQESRGHQSGQTLVALAESGVDQDMRVIGSRGRKPHLRNSTAAEVEQFRQRVQVVDLIGRSDAARIVAEVQASASGVACGCECSCRRTAAVYAPPCIEATPSQGVTLDPAGYFVVIPQPDQELIITEHYDNDDYLLHVIEGTQASAICSTIVESGLVTRLDHAAHLGRGLQRAELSLRNGWRFVQDKA